ncbi:MAG: hypothetical protein EKK34_14715, partial [Mycobacterium sp.]
MGRTTDLGRAGSEVDEWPAHHNQHHWSDAKRHCHRWEYHGHRRDYLRHRRKNESPWFCRRLGLLDSDQWLVGPLCIVERGFE